MIAAILSAVSSAVALITDKIILTRERVALRVYLPISFIFLFGITMLLVPFKGNIDLTTALLPNSMFMFFLMIVIAIAWNVLYYQSVQKEKVHESEMIVMTGPLITTLLAALFFPEEFKLPVFILTLIASAALIFSKTEKAHFKLDIITYNLFLAVILMATENILIRELLYFYTPVALYAVRTFFVAGFFLIYYKPSLNKVSAKHWWMIFLVGLLGVVQMIGKFYAYQQLGIIFTTLLSVVAPIIVFLAGWQFLHERIKVRAMIAIVVVVACIVLATLQQLA